MKYIKLFENFSINENFQDLLWDFINKPVLGGYIVDVTEGPGNTLDLSIASEQDKKDGKKILDFTILGTARYYPNDEWEFQNGQRHRLATKTPEDDK